MLHVSRRTCLLIALVALIGLTGGRLASEALLRLAPPPARPVASVAARPQAARPPLGEMGVAFGFSAAALPAVGAPALLGEARLMGTFFSRAPSALVRQGETTLLVHPGDALGALGTVRQIERGALLVETASGVRRLGLAGEAPAAASPAAAPAPSAGAPMTLSPKAVAAARADLPSLLQSARLAPRTTASGTIDGFVVKMVKPGSLLSSMGVRNGDVLLEAGRIRLDSLDKAMAALRQAQAARSLRLTVERGGAPLVFTYTLPE